MVEKIETKEAFEALVGGPATKACVGFFADWAPQCAQIADVMGELAKMFGGVAFRSVDAEGLAEVSEAYGVEAVPTVVLFSGAGKVFAKVEGASAADLTQKVTTLAGLASSSSASSSSSAPPPAAEDLNARLAKLVSAAPAVLFMKGTPGEPRCGFSRQAIELLRKNNVAFSTFDILSDEKVRQGLKKFSNWPTYPQFYVNGELQGGLDILKELSEEGELEGMVPKKESLDDRLKGLVARSKVMLFMKGSPDEPRCGFSRKICEILKETGVSYDTFDILSDEEVRQGLKKFSNWPTYPQLYKEGELLGGLDIVKELKESGDLADELS